MAYRLLQHHRHQVRRDPLPGILRQPGGDARGAAASRRRHRAAVRGGGPTSGAYIGDDYAGLLSPAQFREFVIPAYARIYAGKTSRFMHSELLRYEHLRLVRDELGITEFHGAGAELLTPAEMHAVMGHAFWTQVTPYELRYLTPAQLADLIASYAQSGAGWVQLYPDRVTPDHNLEAAIVACERECRGGPTVKVSRPRSA